LIFDDFSRTSARWEVRLMPFDIEHRRHAWRALSTSIVTFSRTNGQALPLFSYCE
jgi:hypothetical protein